MNTQRFAAVFALMFALGAAAAQASQVNPYTADANTVVLYHLDESTGATSAADASANALTLTSTLSPFTGVTGPDGLGGAGTFDKSNAGYQLKRTLSGAELSAFSTTAFTIEAWVRNPVLIDNPDVSGEDHDGVLAYRGPTGRFQFTVLGPDSGANAGRIRIDYNRDDTGAFYGSAASNALTWEADLWYHIIVTYDSNTAAANDSSIRYYRNSELDVSGVPQLVGELFNQPDIKPLDVGGALHLGGFENSGPRSFGGDLNEVRYSNGVLTSFNLAVPTPAALPAGLALMGLIGLRRRTHGAQR